MAAGGQEECLRLKVSKFSETMSPFVYQKNWGLKGKKGRWKKDKKPSHACVMKWAKVEWQKCLEQEAKQGLREDVRSERGETLTKRNILIFVPVPFSVSYVLWL